MNLWKVFWRDLETSAKGNRIFLLYLELEADPGNSDGTAEDPCRIRRSGWEDRR